MTGLRPQFPSHLWPGGCSPWDVRQQNFPTCGCELGSKQVRGGSPGKAMHVCHCWGNSRYRSPSPPECQPKASGSTHPCPPKAQGWWATRHRGPERISTEFPLLVSKFPQFSLCKEPLEPTLKLQFLQIKNVLHVTPALSFLLPL